MENSKIDTFEKLIGLAQCILNCENSTPLNFEKHFKIYKTHLDAEIILEEKPFHEALQILLHWISYFEENKISNPKLLITLLSKWDESSDRDSDAPDPEGVIGDLSATMMCFQKNLNYIVETLKDSINILSILDLHIRTRYGTGMVFSLVCDRLLEAFHLENLEDFQWDHLEDTVEETLSASRYDPHFISRELYSETQNNKDVKRYIEHKRKKLLSSIKSKKPAWVHDPKEGENEIVYKSYLSTQSLNSEKIFFQLKDSIEKYVKTEGLNEEQLQELEKITSLSVSLKENFLNTNEQFPPERYYGLSNEILDQDCCGMKGPCRMYYCVCRNEDDYDNTSYTQELNPQSWFIGSCEECGIGIEKFRYAIRFPIKDGGWLGCFCSFECMRKSNIRPYDKEAEFRVKEIKEYIQKIGVVNL
jgi:hypothetical protein